MSSSSQLPAVILSGGSEIVALSLAEALLPEEVPVAVIGLGRASLIRDLPGVFAYRQIDWPPPSHRSGLGSIISILRTWGAGQPAPWPMFATEDGGLRLLMEGRDELQPYVVVAGARVLKGGGLDKAELFEFLQSRGSAQHLAPTMVLMSAEEARAALKALGRDAVFKPALRPYSMEGAGGEPKVITARTQEESVESIVARLARVWPLSSRWVAQLRLTVPSGGEALWWGIRTHSGDVVGMTARERWKQPRMGGSACWVEAELVAGLENIARKVLEEIDFVGIAEIPFLRDSDNRWKLLELNARPWLQVALTTHAGLRLAYAAYCDAAGMVIPAMPDSPRYTSWVNVERMLLVALSGEYGPWGTALRTVWRVVRTAGWRVVYDTPYPRVRRRWLFRMLGIAWRRMVSLLGLGLRRRGVDKSNPPSHANSNLD